MTGSPTLARYRAARLRVACERCNRHGNYSTARLIERYGSDYRLPELLSNLTADCDLPPLKWSSLKYGFGHQGGLQW